MKGQILKGIGGFYYVLSEGNVVETRARGRFRKYDIKPIPGDYVEFLPPTDTSGGYLEKVLPRKNMLKRPAVANIDLLLIVVSAGKPEPDLLLVDKLMLYAACQKIPCKLVVNKIDTHSPEGILGDYPGALCVSAETGEGMDLLKQAVQGKSICFAGQSAVGKSSIINAFGPEEMQETGGLSQKTDRGKHTTRSSSLIYFPELEATVIDTPGFSILEVVDIQPEELSGLYPEFADCECKFAECTHRKEPHCGVKDALAKGLIPQGRYDRYLQLLAELIQRREKRYE